MATLMPIGGPRISIMTDINRAPLLTGVAHGNLGKGYNSISGKFYSNALDPPQFSQDKDESVIGTFQKITSHYDFIHMLSLSASAAFAGFGMEASVSMNFFKSIEITQDSFYVAANLVVTKSRQVVQYPSFTREASRLLAANEYTTFLQRYGDQYCSEIVFGGQLILLFRMYAETLNEQERLDVQLGGSFGFFSAAASLAEVLSKIKNDQTIHLQVAATGQTPPINSKPEEITEFVKNFPTTITDNGYVLQQNFLDHTTVTNNVPLHAHVPDLSENKRKISQLATVTNKLDTYIEKLRYIKEYSFQFKFDKPEDISSIETKQAALEKMRTQVDAIAEAILADPINYNKPLPPFDPTGTVEPLPPILHASLIPIILDVNSGTQTYSGNGEDWVGAPGAPLNWLRTRFALPSFNSPDPPIYLLYRVGYLTTGGDVYVTVSASSTIAIIAPIYSISFSLGGRNKDLYDVEYQAELKDGRLTPPGRNDTILGHPDRSPRPSPTDAMCRLQLRIISKS